jgi:hypothetical protein
VLEDHVNKVRALLPFPVRKVLEGRREARRLEAEELEAARQRAMRRAWGFDEDENEEARQPPPHCSSISFIMKPPAASNMLGYREDSKRVRSFPKQAARLRESAQRLLAASRTAIRERLLAGERAREAASLQPGNVMRLAPLSRECFPRVHGRVVCRPSTPH